MKTKLILAVFLTLVLTSLVFAQTNTTGSNQSNVSSSNSTNKVCPVIAAPVCKAGEKLKTYTGDDGCQKVKCVPVASCPLIAAPVCKSGEKIQTYNDEDGCMKARCVIQSNVTGSNSTNKQCPKSCVCTADTVACPSEQEKTITTSVSSSKAKTPSSGTTSSSTSTISISKTSSGKTSVQSGNAYAISSSNISVIDSKLTMQTSKGENKEIKIMPDTASEKAISTLQLKQNVTIELKDTGKPVYAIEGTKDVKVLALFKAEMKVQSEVDAETGEVISVNKPWWSFLAKE